MAPTVTERAGRTEKAPVSPEAVQHDTRPTVGTTGAVASPPQLGSDQTWKVYRWASTWLTEPVPPPPAVPSGPAMAAILGNGIGAAALGILITASESFKPVSDALTVDAGVGPLSGKTAVAIVVWLAAWAALHLLWRNREVGSRPVLIASAILVGVGLLGTFPPVYANIAHLMGG